MHTPIKLACKPCPTRSIRVRRVISGSTREQRSAELIPSMTTQRYGGLAVVGEKMAIPLSVPREAAGTRTRRRHEAKAVLYRSTSESTDAFRGSRRPGDDKRRAPRVGVKPPGRGLPMPGRSSAMLSAKQSVDELPRLQPPPAAPCMPIPPTRSPHRRCS
jgi:hypothetical protein